MSGHIAHRRQRSWSQATVISRLPFNSSSVSALHADGVRAAGLPPVFRIGRPPHSTGAEQYNHVTGEFAEQTESFAARQAVARILGTLAFAALTTDRLNAGHADTMSQRPFSVSVIHNQNKTGVL